MAATVFGAGRYGIVNDSSATGLSLASFTTNYSADIAFGKDHIGCDAMMSIYNDSSEVSCSGVVAVKATGLVPDLAAVLTLANSSADTLATNSKNLFSTNNANAALIVTGASLTRANSDFETGEVSGIFKPLIPTNSPTVLT
jgi:hypothetical protein